MEAEGHAGVYVRVGSSNRRADAALVDEMRRFANRQSYDEEPMPGLRAEAVDFRAASESFALVRKLRRQDLQTLRLLVRDQGRRVPTVGGVLLFGSDKERDFPDAWIQAGRFRGASRADIADQREIHGHAPTLVREAVDFVAKHLLCEARIDGVRREERWNIPPLAVREAIVNAVAHADYAQRGAPIRVAVFDDRVEVENPGLLPFGLTVEDLPFGVSKLRNRVISRVFREIGLMENWGTGVQRMMAACEDAGCPPPVFEELGGRFRVTLGTAARRTVADAVDTALLNALRVTEGLSTGELAALVGRSPRTVRTRMKRLVERELVREIGAGPNDPRRRYHLIG